MKPLFKYQDQFNFSHDYIEMGLEQPLREIDVLTFHKKLGANEYNDLAEMLDYPRQRHGGVVMIDDWKPVYYRSLLNGLMCYLMELSGECYLYTQAS